MPESVRVKLIFGAQVPVFHPRRGASATVRDSAFRSLSGSWLAKPAYSVTLWALGWPQTALEADLMPLK